MCGGGAKIVIEYHNILAIFVLTLKSIKPSIQTDSRQLGRAKKLDILHITRLLAYSPTHPPHPLIHSFTDSRRERTCSNVGSWNVTRPKNSPIEKVRSRTENRLNDPVDPLLDGLLDGLLPL